MDNTIWNVKGNSTLTPNSPVTLEWDNNEGLVFTKKIELDDKFLFKITQGIKNTSNKSFRFYPYAQITRNYKTEGMNIYILQIGCLFSKPSISVDALYNRFISDIHYLKMK